MLRLGQPVEVQAVAVARGGADQALVKTVLAHDLLRLDAVLVGVKFKVEIVQKPDDLPEIRFLAVAELFCVPTHDVGDDARML